MCTDSNDTIRNPVRERTGQFLARTFEQVGIPGASEDASEDAGADASAR